MVRISLIVIIAILCFGQVIACAPQDDDTIRIGCVLSLSAELGPKGKDRLEAARLAVSEVNANGGVLGKQLQLVEKDDATDAQRCLKEVENIAGSGKVQAIIGGMSSDAVIATGHYLAEKKIVMISPSATASAITDYPWTNWFFRTVPSDAFQGKILAQIIMENGFMNLATIVPANSYGQGLEAVLTDELKRAGWKGKQSIQIYFDPAKSDFTAELTNIKNDNPDVVLAVSYVEDGKRIFNQALSLGLDTIPWLACDGNHGDVMFENKQCAEFMEKAILAGTRFAGPLAGEQYDSFAAGFKDRTGKDPGVYCDTTYDAVKMLAAAIEKAGTYDGSAIKDALLELGNGYQGASGTVTFDKNGDRITGIFEIWNVIEAYTAESGYRNVRSSIIRIE
jgi:ABC-type branched-subunit amino acid transport system substrate-binding protein